MIPCEYSEIFQNRFCVKHLRWLLLHTLLKIVKFIIWHKQLAILAKYCGEQFIFYQINCLLIDICYLKLSLVNFNYSIYPCLTPNALLRKAMCTAREALLGIVSIHELGKLIGSREFKANAVICDLVLCLESTQCKPTRTRES